MRVDIPVVGPAYTNREKPLSAQVTKNLWPEINPEARSIIALHNTPGLKDFTFLEGIDRGVHDFNNLLYTVSGNSLWSVDADAITKNLGTISGTGRCVFADDGNQLIITTGGTPYRYTVSDGLEAITDPDLVKPTSVAYLNSQFIFDQNSGTFGEFVTSELTQGFSINALDFATAEAHPDDIIRVIAFNQLVYFFGSHSMEPWWNSGTGRPPFDRVQGGVRPYGLAGTHAITTTLDNIYFLGRDRIPRRMPGLDAQPIGTPALGVEFARYSKIDDCICFNYVQDGQYFIVFTFPTADKTWVYHEPSGSWFNWSYGVNGARSRANSCINIYGQNLVADHTNGFIYELDPCTYTDSGQEIQRDRVTHTIHGGLYGVPGKKLYFDKVELVIAYGICEVRGTGQGPQPINQPAQGVCATTADVIQSGLILPAHGLQMCVQPSHTLNNTTVDTDGFTLSDSKIFSCTFAFAREFNPSDARYGHLLLIDDQLNKRLAVWLDTSGFIRIEGRNVSNVKILDVTITNNGSSWVDSTAHLFSVVIDLSDTAKREIFVDGLNITENTSYVTWTTYTDDLIQFEGLLTDDMGYAIAVDALNGGAWGNTLEDIGNGISSVGYISFANSCILVGAALWDADGKVNDPQGDFTGWYTQQPQIAFGPSLWKQAGTFAGFEIPLYPQGFSNFYDFEDVHLQADGSRINGDSAGTTETGTETLPPPTTVPTNTLPSPHWNYLSDSMSYNHVNLSSYTNVGFAAEFGLPIEDRSFFEQTVTGSKAIRVNTTDPDQKLTLVFIPSQFSKAAIVLTDASGTIEDWCYVFNTAAVNGSSVTVPADGEDHYLVITSDTGSCKVRMWDST